MADQVTHPALPHEGHGPIFGELSASPVVPRVAVFQALVGLMFVDVALRTLGYAWLKGRLTRSAPKGEARTDLQGVLREVLAAVDRAAVFYPRRAMCLQRSAVIKWLLRKNGVHAYMVIGCRHTPFYAHAWVEVYGHVVNDRPEVAQMYPELERV